MAHTNPDPNHVLYVTFRESAPYLTVTARVMAWQEGPDGRYSLRNIPVGGYDPDPLAGIVASGQSDNRTDDDGRHDSDRTFSYGWTVGFQTDTDTASADACAAAAATLRRIDKRTDSLRASLGAPATFGAYVARIAAALNLRVVTLPDGASAPTYYSDSEYRVWSAGDAVNVIDGRIASFRAPVLAR